MENLFETLLSEYSEAAAADQRENLERRLWQEFGAERAVLVMDLSRFSTLTEKYGIVYNLAIIRRMQHTARPLIEAEGGRVVKFEADNCFAMFEDVLPAIRASIAIHHALEKLVSRSNEPFAIRVGIGIDYGQVLLVEENDYFGLTVNRASKLGEDLAQAGDILITASAFERLPSGSEIHSIPFVSTISGMDLSLFRIQY